MNRTTMRTHARTLTLVALVAMPGGCTQLDKLDDSGSEATIPTEVQRAFDDTCNLAGCHDANARAGDLDLSADASASIIGGPSMQSTLPLVELGNVQGSFLALKLLPNPPAGAQMPFGGDLQGLDNAIILGWIAGAELPGGGEAGDSTTDTSADTMTPGEESTTGPAEPVLCGLEDVAPTEPNPYDIGTNAGQIPPDVGEALTNNCGCHGVDELVADAMIWRYTGEMSFTTINEIRADYMGMPVYARMLGRVQDTANPMPPTYYCDLGDGTTITAEDRQLLIDWLMAEAPDATVWMP